MSLVIRLSSHQTADSSIVIRGRRNGNIGVAKSWSSKWINIRSSRIGILLSQVAKTPVLFNSTEGGEVYFDIVIGWIVYAI